MTTKDILQDIINHLSEDAPVKEIVKGAFWTAVVSKYCGLSSAMQWERCGEDGLKGGPLKSYKALTAIELSRLSMSDNVSDASLGVAAINSLIRIDYSKCVEKNAGDILLDIGRDKNISIVGHFPFTEDLRKVTKNLWVIEKRQRPGDLLEEDAKTFLPQSDIVAISSTTLINKTFSHLINLCRKDAIKILLGPTTPLTEILFSYGIDILSGIVVVDLKKTLKYISEGANFRQIKQSGAVKLITMLKK